MSARTMTTVRGLAILALAATSLGGCAGTDASLTGSVCGEQVALQVRDRKDRSGFEAFVTCANGGSLHLTSSDSSTSSVLAAQAQLLQTLSSLIAQLAVAAPPMAWTPPLPPSQREAISARIDHALQMDNSMTWNPEWIR